MGAVVVDTEYLALGLGVIPIADAGLARLYGAEPAAVTYQPGCLERAIREAMGIDPADRAERRLRMARARSDALAASLQNIANAVSEISVAGR